MVSRVEIRLDFNWNVGKVKWNEIAYRIDELIPKLACEVVGKIVDGYQEEVVERLTGTYSSAERAGLGRHHCKGETEKACRGRRVIRQGYRKSLRSLNSKYGTVRIRVQEVECEVCGARFAPILDALGLEPYKRSDEVLEKEVIAAVMDTNYRRLIEGHALDVSLGGIHDFVAGSDIDELLGEELELDRYRAVLGDGTGLKKAGGKSGEMRVLVGITASGRLEPIGSWVDTAWEDIEREVKGRIKSDPTQPPLLLYDGEPKLEDFLAGTVCGHQRCTWHAPRGLYHAMWEDGARKKEIAPHQEQLAKIVAVEIPKGDYDRLSADAIEEVRKKYNEAKKEMSDLIEILYQKNCPHAVEYLKNLTRGLHHHVEMWLATGIIAPTTISRLERLFRELGRRLKRIAWGWSDRIATKLSKMIMIKQYKPELWRKYWLKKLGIQGHFQIRIAEVVLA